MAKTNIKVNGVDHVVLHVRDLERSKQFYMDILGFEFRHEFSRPDLSMAFLRCGNQGLDLCEVPVGDIHGGAGDGIDMALRVTAGEREEIVAELAKVGVEVFGRPNDPTTMYLDDPDGHRLQLLAVASEQQHEAEVRESAKVS